MAEPQEGNRSPVVTGNTNLTTAVVSKLNGLVLHPKHFLTTADSLEKKKKPVLNFVCLNKITTLLSSVQVQIKSYNSVILYMPCWHPHDITRWIRLLTKPRIYTSAHLTDPPL